MRSILPRVLFLLPVCIGSFASAEDGATLWLRYPRIADAEARDALVRAVRSRVVHGEGATIDVIGREIDRAMAGFTGEATRAVAVPEASGSLVVARLDRLRPLGVRVDDADRLRAVLGTEGYAIRTTGDPAGRNTLVTANSDVGLLHGTFALLRHVQTGGDLAKLDVTSSPRVRHRVLQHWDNLDGSTERVYSEDPRSVWWNGDAAELAVPVERWHDYGRACASVGINVVVINNVNASTQALVSPALTHAARIADVLRPYGIRVGLSANYAAPLAPDRKIRLGPGIGDATTTDPRDPRVVAFWARKVDEIYAAIPDFAGFLVKAGAEGMSGPESSGASAADGANMLGKLLAPRGGIVMWRAFTWDDGNKDLVQRQFDRFAPQDAAFARGNVFLQTKYGPRDFMPREPFHPLFAAMTNAQLSLELQVTQEYTGHDQYLVYLGPLWQEILRTDVRGDGGGGAGSTLARVIDGSLHGYDASQIAGVANVSRVTNWTGHPFAAANWYAFGRFAWDPDADAGVVAREWAAMTWGNDAAVLEPVVDLMMRSHETMANTVGPLGICHTNTRDGAHYEPTPHPDDYWQRQFIGATPTGIGTDRTRATGTGATGQYPPAIAARFEDVAICPENLLLWFHHVCWNDRLPSGDTVWETLVRKYDDGVAGTARAIGAWRSLRDRIDPQRYQQVHKRLEAQHAHARKFRDRWLTHFQKINGLPLPGTRAR